MFKTVSLNQWSTAAVALSPLNEIDYSATIQFKACQFEKGISEESWGLFFDLLPKIFDDEDMKSICKNRIETIGEYLYLFSRVVKYQGMSYVLLDSERLNQIIDRLKEKKRVTHIACNAMYDNALKNINNNNLSVSTHTLKNVPSLFNNKNAECVFIQIHYECLDPVDYATHFFALIRSSEGSLVLDTYQGEEGYFLNPKQIQSFLDGQNDPRFEKVLNLLVYSCDKPRVNAQDSTFKQLWKAAFNGISPMFSERYSLYSSSVKYSRIESDSLRVRDYLEKVCQFANSVISSAES